VKMMKIGIQLQWTPTSIPPILPNLIVEGIVSLPLQNESLATFIVERRGRVVQKGLKAAVGEASARFLGAADIVGDEAVLRIGVYTLSRSLRQR
jgi:hypothetical protein